MKVLRKRALVPGNANAFKLASMSERDSPEIARFNNFAMQTRMRRTAITTQLTKSNCRTICYTAFCVIIDFLTWWICMNGIYMWTENRHGMEHDIHFRWWSNVHCAISRIFQMRCHTIILNLLTIARFGTCVHEPLFKWVRLIMRRRMHSILSTTLRRIM